MDPNATGTIRLLSRDGVLADAMVARSLRAIILGFAEAIGLADASTSPSSHEYFNRQVELIWVAAAPVSQLPG